VGDFRQVHATWRVGVLTHPLVMAATSHQGDSSVILRGRLLFKNVLCGSLATPPANAAAFEASLPTAPTPRARYEARAKNATCQGCHQFLDPLGFGFEAYDGLGRHRDMAYGAPVDAAGVMRTGQAGLDGDFVGARAFVDKVLADDWGRRCFARQWTRSAYGLMETDAQGLTPLACTADRLGTALVQQHSMAAMLDAWVTDPSFGARAMERSTP
jgi:hypothetical protein